MGQSSTEQLFAFTNEKRFGSEHFFAAANDNNFLWLWLCPVSSEATHQLGFKNCLQPALAISQAWLIRATILSLQISYTRSLGPQPQLLCPFMTGS